MAQDEDCLGYGPGRVAGLSVGVTEIILADEYSFISEIVSKCNNIMDHTHQAETVDHLRVSFHIASFVNGCIGLGNGV